MQYGMLVQSVEIACQVLFLVTPAMFKEVVAACFLHISKIRERALKHVVVLHCSRSDDAKLSASNLQALALSCDSV